MLHGYIDGVSRSRIHGWMRDAEDIGTPLALLVVIDDLPVIRIIADRERGDLTAVGIGRHAFDLAIIEPLSPLVPHVIRITEETTGQDCPGSPHILQAAFVLDQAAERHFASALVDYSTAEDFLYRVDFLDRLSRQLKQRERERCDAALGRDDRRNGSLRALVIDEVMPQLAHDAGSVAILSHCDALRSSGIEVIFAPSNMAAGPQPVISQKPDISFVSYPACETIEELLKNNRGTYDVIYLHRWTVAARYIPLIRYYQPGAKIIYSVADLQHLRYLRQATAERRPELADYAAVIRRSEFGAAASADLVVTHSVAESALLGSIMDPDKVKVIPWAISPRPGAPSFDERHGLAFVGHYAHEANLAGAIWLVDEIMPKVREGNPSVECSLVGSCMPDILKHPASGITARGHVDDLSSMLSRVRATVAPLTYGAGIKGKVLDSLALGVPCVCTPVAAEGVDLGPALRSLVSSGTEGIAAAILRVHDDQSLYLECRREGLELIARDNSEERVARLMGEALRSIDFDLLAQA